MAATIRQTSFERSFHEQESSGESAEAQSARVVSEHLKEDHMGLLVQLEHILATAVQRTLLRTTYPLLLPKLTHCTAKLCFVWVTSASLRVARGTPLALTSCRGLPGPSPPCYSPTPRVLCHAQALLRSHPPPPPPLPPTGCS